jgi:hypothetical protein
MGSRFLPLTDGRLLPAQLPYVRVLLRNPTTTPLQKQHSMQRNVVLALVGLKIDQILPLILYLLLYFCLDSDFNTDSVNHTG